MLLLQTGLLFVSSDEDPSTLMPALFPMLNTFDPGNCRVLPFEYRKVDTIIYSLLPDPFKYLMPQNRHSGGKRLVCKDELTLLLSCFDGVPNFIAGEQCCS